MSAAFVIRNQLGHYLGKAGNWVKGGHPGQVAFWEHRDEAVNTLFELGSKDTNLRGEIVLSEMSDGKPHNLVISEHPLPKPPPEAAEDPLENNGADPTS